MNIFESSAKYDDYSFLNCPNCREIQGRRLVSLPAPARGSFGTVARKSTKSSTAIRDEKLKESKSE